MTDCNSDHQKRKRHRDGIEIGIGESALTVITGESTSDYKNELHDQQHQQMDALPNGLLDSSASYSLENDALIDTPKTSEPDSMDVDHPDEDDDNAYDEDDDDANDEDEDDYENFEYDTDLIETDIKNNMASKWDDIDIPPGVEATIPWLVPSSSKHPSSIKAKEVIEEDIAMKLKVFKQFDTVMDASDHHYALKASAAANNQQTKWTQRIHHEWRLLEQNLPETIFVRVYEDRMDLLRAVIIGSAGTPYHDGLFFFDAQFPSSYPATPPVVYYHAGGLRLNPNLYDNGYVCLSLLGTWPGKDCEMWSPSKSNMLQVLLSIQALVLNEKPFFNEPGYAKLSNTTKGEKKSLEYNERTFLLSCKTMLYALRRPPKHFGDLVAGHFYNRGGSILASCVAYMDGAPVGCHVKDDADADDDNVEGMKSEASKTFKSDLQKIFDDLLMEFTVKGADCDKFLAHKVKAGIGAAAKATEGSMKPLEQALNF